MIALDTNILVFAHRADLPEHRRAHHWVRSLAEGHAPWGLTVFSLGEFARVVTHPRVFNPPSTLDQALAALAALTESPGSRLLSPGPQFTAHYFDALKAGQTSGNLAVDAQIAAACREQGIGRLLTTDRDLSRFPWIEIVDLEEDTTRFV